MEKGKAGRLVDTAAMLEAWIKMLTKTIQSNQKVLKKSWTLIVIMLLPAIVAPSHVNHLLQLLHMQCPDSCMTLVLCTLGCSKVVFPHPI